MTTTKRTTILVTGDFTPSTFRPGAEFSAKMHKALELQARGQSIEVLTEPEFVARLGSVMDRVRAASIQRRRGTSKLPDWVIANGRTAPTDDYWAWFRAALKHPEGRAKQGDPCVWCDDSIGGKTYWLYLERHVCSAHCNELLKRAFGRARARGDFDQL